MSDSSEARVIAIGALGLAACCALPVLVGSGVVASLAGLWSGSGLLVVAGLVLPGLVGVRRWRRRSCAMPTGSDQASPSGPVDEEERRDAQPEEKMDTARQRRNPVAKRQWFSIRRQLLSGDG